MFVLKKGFPKSLPLCVLIMLWVAIFLSVNLSHGIGDLEVYVERVDNPDIDKCKYCGRRIKVRGIHKDAEVIIKRQIKEKFTEKGMGYGEGKEKKTYISVLIYKFIERKGGNFAVEKPAGVGFHMHLMEDNAVQQVFVFDEDQQALSENVLNLGKFLRRGGRWVTADELSAEGIDAGLYYLLEERE